MAYYSDLFLIGLLILSPIVLLLLALRGPPYRVVAAAIAIVIAIFLMAVMVTPGALNWEEHGLLAYFLELASLLLLFLLPFVLVLVLIAFVLGQLLGKARPKPRTSPRSPEEDQQEAVWREVEKILASREPQRKVDGEKK
jgi:hypothetical protein